ncbi:hypothetical protein ScPMuIL_010778 [Solemya velum]
MERIPCNQSYYEIFVGHLPLQTSDDELHQLFKGCGEIVGLQVPKVSSENEFRYGFVRFCKKESALSAVAQMHRWSFKGLNIVVEIAHSTKIQLEQERKEEPTSCGINVPERTTQKPQRSTIHKRNLRIESTCTVQNVLNFSRLKETCNNLNLELMKGAGSKVRRESDPVRIQQYVESIFPLYGELDLRAHFRMRRGTFQIVSRTDFNRTKIEFGEEVVFNYVASRVKTFIPVGQGLYMMRGCLSRVPYLRPSEFHLIGNSAYPMSENLLIPFRDNGHLGIIEKKYNKCHSSTRVDVERAIGLLKSKFRRLKYLDMYLEEEITDFIAACCLLHNFILKEEDAIDNVDDTDTDNISSEDIDQVVNEHLLAPAQAKRWEIANLF